MEEILAEERKKVEKEKEEQRQLYQQLHKDPSKVSGMSGPSVRRPYGETGHLNGLMESILNGDYGPRYTTPAVVLTTTQQQEAAALQLHRLTEQLKRDQALRDSFKKDKRVEEVTEVTEVEPVQDRVIKDEEPSK